VEIKKYICEDKSILEFEPLNKGVEDIPKRLNIDTNDLDTIIVAAYDEGFDKEFIENKCWYPLRIGIKMRYKLKYIAAYRVSPKKRITHYAEISRIELYEDTGKYIVFFKDTPQELSIPIPLNDANSSHAPQPISYTNFKKIIEANATTTLDDLY